MAKLSKSAKLPKAVFIKAQHIMSTEGTPRKQALAIAASYYRRGKLSKTGQLKK